MTKSATVTAAPSRNPRQQQKHSLPELKHNYRGALRQLHDIFPDWQEDDLVAVLLELNGDIELAAQRITEGHANTWAERGKKQQISKKDPARHERENKPSTRSSKLQPNQRPKEPQPSKASQPPKQTQEQIPAPRVETEKTDLPDQQPLTKPLASTNANTATATTLNLTPSLDSQPAVAHRPVVQGEDNAIAAKAPQKPHESTATKKSETKRYISIKSRTTPKSKKELEVPTAELAAEVPTVQTHQAPDISIPTTAAIAEPVEEFLSTERIISALPVVEMPTKLSSRMAETVKTELPVVIMPIKANVHRNISVHFGDSAPAIHTPEVPKAAPPHTTQNRFSSSGVETIFSSSGPRAQHEQQHHPERRVANFVPTPHSGRMRENIMSPPPGLLTDPSLDQSVQSSFKPMGSPAPQPARYSSYTTMNQYVEEPSDIAPGFHGFAGGHSRANPTYNPSSMGFGRPIDASKNNPPSHQAFFNGFDSFSNEYGASNRPHQNVPYYSNPHYAQHVMVMPFPRSDVVLICVQYPESYQQNPYMPVNNRYPQNTYSTNPMPYQGTHFFAPPSGEGIMPNNRNHPGPGRQMLPSHFHQSNAPHHK